MLRYFENVHCKDLKEDINGKAYHPYCWAGKHISKIFLYVSPQIKDSQQKYSKCLELNIDSKVKYKYAKGKINKNSLKNSEKLKATTIKTFR